MIAGFAENERRREFRRRTLKAGGVVDPLAATRDDCVIRNQSAGGAKLVLDEARVVPALFRLDTDGACRPVELVWQSGAELGIRFLDAG